MDLTANARHLVFLDKSRYTKFYKRYLNSYHTMDRQLKSRKDDADSIAGNYYGLLAVHNMKTNSMDILLSVQSISSMRILKRGIGWRRRDTLISLFHKRIHSKSRTGTQFVLMKKMCPKLGKVNCITFKGMPPVPTFIY